jgi:hypothetical protein
VIVPASMSVLLPSFMIERAARALVMPPPWWVPLERFPERLNRDSHGGANMIQASCWEEASRNGEALFGGSA